MVEKILAAATLKKTKTKTKTKKKEDEDEDLAAVN